MQKIAFLLSISLLSSFAFAEIDAVMAEKVKQMTREVLNEERQKLAANSRDALIMQTAGVRLDNMLLRLSTMENALAYYSRIKRKLTIDIMDRMTPEVARACCPLNPGALQGQRWYFRNKGNKFKGKGLSGARDKKEKGGKNRNRGRGKNKKNQGGGSAVHQPRPMSHLI